MTQAADIQRMKSNFIATASHQLRTPMASILATSELLGSQRVPPAKHRQLLELIQSQSTRMTDMLDTLLNVSHVESGHVELKIVEFDAQAMCEAVAKDFEVRAGDYEFEVNIPESVRHIRTDKQRFIQIIEDLVDNAVKYSIGPSSVMIKAELSRGHMIQFAVSDTGVGIDPSGLKEMFMPFSRISSEQTSDVPGTGLGLYLAKNLTELLGGRIWAESRVGWGTTVFFTIPQAVAVEHETALERAFDKDLAI